MVEWKVNDVRDILFDNVNKVSFEEVKDKMNYYINSADKAMELYEQDKQESFELAKQIRTEIDKEYKNIDLIRTRYHYKDNKYFSAFKKAVHESSASIVGRTTHNNFFSFLYDVSSYMRYYFPRKE